MSDASLKKDLWRIIGVISALSVLSVLVVLILTEEALARQKQEILEQKMTTANALASRFQLRVEDATKVLQIAAANDEFLTVNDADKVSEQYKGIPIDLEEGKRNLARDVLEQYGSFETVAFALPNGDIYFVEPYERQLSLPRLNFADREWYTGPIETGEPYAADALISTATNHRVIPIGIPVYSASGSLSGIMVGALDLELLEQQLREELNLSHNNRVIYVDDKGNAIEDVSEKTVDTFTAISSLAHLQSVKNVIAGQSGYLVEDVDTREVLTIYRPAVIDGRNWGVLVMQPTGDAYSAIDFLRNQSYVMLAIIITIMAAAGYLLVSFRTHSSLARELVKANNELIEKEKLKDEFLKIASHELRTPIQPILGYASLGVRGLIKDNEAWKVVHKEAQRLMKLSNNIVDISMVQSGILTYKMEKTRIIEVVQSAVESYRPSAQEKGISLELNVDDKFDNIEIDADASRLTHVFAELLENAVKFTDKGGIQVECRAETEKLVIRFSDTGTAISANFLPRIFDMFSSISVNDPTTQGAGLGLFISKAIMTAHGGTIVARNNIEGPGATFEVTLPINLLQEFVPKTRAAVS
jgi:signal transduction histidine kinase